MKTDCDGKMRFDIIISILILTTELVFAILSTYN